MDKPSFLSLKKNYDALFFAIAGWLMVFFFTRHGGIGLSPDSLTYITTAKNLAATGALNEFNNSPMIDFPAGYPIFLCWLIKITGHDPVSFGTVLNGCLFAITLFLSGCILQRFLTASRLYKNILLLCLSLSPALVEIYSMLWSETVFIVWLMLFFIAMRHYFNAHKLLPLFVAALVVSLSCVTRYAGITLLGTGCMMLLFDRQLILKKKILHLVIFFIVGIACVSINLVRNYSTGGFLTGNREKGITPLLQNVEHYGSVLCDWLPFLHGQFALAATVAIVAFIVCCIVFVRHVFNKNKYHSYENLALAYFITYTVFIVGSATLSHYETLNSRLLSPLSIPFLWVVTYSIPAFIKNQKGSYKKILFVTSILLSFFFIRNEYIQTKELYDDAHKYGVPGYNDDSWKYSPIITYLQQKKDSLQPPRLIYSNAMEAVTFFTGLNCEPLPHYVFKEEVRDYLIERPHYLVWFNNTDNPGLFHLNEVAQSKKMTLLQSFADGSIYWCEHK